MRASSGWTLQQRPVRAMLVIVIGVLTKDRDLLIRPDHGLSAAAVVAVATLRTMGVAAPNETICASLFGLVH